MAAEDLLRLAWEAEHDGRRSLRDALLTLAVAEAGPGQDWAERCRSLLVRERPNHFLGGFATVGQALGDARVVASLDRLRRKYPEVRVRWLLLRAQAARGPYTGRAESLGAMIDDLAGSPAEAENVRLDLAQAARGPLSRARTLRPVAFSLAYPPMTWSGGSGASGSPAGAPPASDRPDPAEPRYHYLSMVFAVAMLLASIPPED